MIFAASVVCFAAKITNKKISKEKRSNYGNNFLNRLLTSLDLESIEALLYSSLYLCSTLSLSLSNFCIVELSKEH